MNRISSRSRAPLLIGLAVAAVVGGAVLAQIEGEDRGIAPIDSSSNYEVGGVPVDVSGPTADAARMGGWRQAQRTGWKMLWSRANGRPAAQAPNLGDGALDAMVAGIVVEREQIGPRRYIATLGVLFDRARTGRLLGATGNVRRSAPMLVVPVMWSGGVPTSFERRNDWQRAWAKFRSGGSPVDYVRPVGNRADPLLLNISQTTRHGRAWWRALLDQYGAADVVSPQVWIERQWPGGPVIARFVAKHGPDGRTIARFALRAERGDGLPALLDEGVRRIDDAYADELRRGGLNIDPTLVIEEELPPEAEAAIAESLAEVPVEGLTQDYVLQVETPTAGALSFAEQSLRGLPGARASSTSSLALGGISLIRLRYDGDLAALRNALAARGWEVSDAGGALRIRRAPPAPAAPPPAAATPTPAPAP